MLMGLPDKWNTCSRTIPVEDEPSAFAHWGNVIAVGLESNRVVLLDAITGSRKSVLSGHEDVIMSLAFSLDGTLLVSGSGDKTIKLWDVQTGGVVTTFSDHTSAILAVSISPDRTVIASGTQDGTVCLWDVRTGKCYPVVGRHNDLVTAVTFSPTVSRRFISSSMDGNVQRWGLDGHRVETPPTKATSVFHVAYTPDGTRFASCGGSIVTVRDSESWAVVVQINAPKEFILLRCCSFSPDGRFVACAAADTIYVWDITCSEAPLFGSFVGHSKSIISIAFSSPSSLISLSLDRSVKVWQVSSPLAELVTADDTPAQPGSALIESVHLFTEDGVVVTSDSSGEVKIRALATGTCESSSLTPAHGIRDVHSAGDTLVVVWRAPVRDGEEYIVWDVRRCQFRSVGSSLHRLLDLRISGDGSKIFGLDSEHIEARSLQTGEAMGIVRHRNADPWRNGLVVHGSKVWLASSKDVGWDFGRREVSTFSPSSASLDRPRLGLVESARGTANPARIEDTVTGRPVFYLPVRYIGTGMRRKWDGRYLIIWSPSEEVMIVDFNSVCPR